VRGTAAVAASIAGSGNMSSWPGRFSRAVPAALSLVRTACRSRPWGLLLLKPATSKLVIS